MKTKSNQIASMFGQLVAVFAKADRIIDQYIAHFLEQIEKVTGKNIE